MQETVQYQLKAFNGKFTPGDVILANHPLAGGSHLPDLTVITPVFYRFVHPLRSILKKEKCFMDKDVVLFWMQCFNKRRTIVNILKLNILIFFSIC